MEYKAHCTVNAAMIARALGIQCVSFGSYGYSPRLDCVTLEEAQILDSIFKEKGEWVCWVPPLPA